MKEIDQELDSAWSELVKLKAKNKCEYCGSPFFLESHHVHGRRKKSVRWDFDNGVCLCTKHHTISSTFSAHRTEDKFERWFERRRGKQFVSELLVKANQISKLHDFEKEELLESIKGEIESLK